MSEHQEIWCQPADQPKRQFLVMFDDPQMDVAVFDDEQEARAFWEKANLNWTCYLMGAMPRSPSPVSRVAPAPAGEDVAGLLDRLEEETNQKFVEGLATITRAEIEMLRIALSRKPSDAQTVGDGSTSDASGTKGSDHDR